jgi:predicted anti-sigma-YlaC factor YlaD
MNHEDIKTLLTIYIEGELEEEDKKLVQAHLKECAECRKELEELNQLEEVLTKMQLKKPSKEIWEQYWSSIYNRLERKTGWIAFSLGFIILISFGVYQAMGKLLKDPDTPLVFLIGLLTFIGGGIILFVSILKEQLFFKKKERYEEIDK